MYKTKNYPGKKLNICGDPLNIRKIIYFKEIFRRMNKPTPDFIKPDFQGSLIEDKYISMIESYKLNPSYLHLKDMITVLELNGTLYIIDGQHRIEMACLLYLEDPTIHDYLIFCYRKVKNMSQARELFDEINKDSYKNKLYIQSPSFVKICADGLKNELRMVYSKLFRRKSSVKCRIKTLDDFINELIEIKFINTDDDPNDLYDKLMMYNKKFYNDFNYRLILNKVPNAFYKVEQRFIDMGIIISIKGTNFIDYLKHEGDIEPNHTFRRTKAPITRGLKLAVWNREFSHRMSSTCPIPLCMNILTHDNFECGHVISEYNGGLAELHNLRPICKSCNSSMGSTNWDDWIEKNQKIKLSYYDNVYK